MPLRPLYSEQDQQRVREILPRIGLATETYRLPYRRDYARLIHSAAFRRLQGKTQLFRGQESDFFRNRLTHSLEVAQIAKSIAIRLNNIIPFFRKNPIDLDLIETVSLAHDLGHPPFGHNGEAALDDCMKKYGGFEGNAQTLRILSRLEKRDIANYPDVLPPGIDERGKDHRLGLNLTYRTLAGVLKYDRLIPLKRRSDAGLVKGYYCSEAGLVKMVKGHVIRMAVRGEVKTLECSIMDISDDIAYSIYDLEDSFKAGFTTPLDMLAINDELATKVADKVVRNGFTKFTKHDVLRVLHSIFNPHFGGFELYQKNIKAFATSIVPHFLSISKRFSSIGYLRAELTSYLVTEFIQGVRVKLNQRCPPLSKAYLDTGVREKVEVLKHYTYLNLVMSPMLKVAEYRGYDIVKGIFIALSEPKGFLLMPADFQEVFSRVSGTEQKRVICDFIAGMTDRYAVEFYGRLYSENPQTIFKPL